MSYTISKTGEEISALLDSIGDRTLLQTQEKGDLVAAINELFTSASEGKSAIAAALTGMGMETAASESWAAMAAKIDGFRKVSNDGGITPTGSYATAAYYNTAYGVKIGYMANGDVILSMQGGTTTAYEYLYFTLASAPGGVSLTAANSFVSTSYVTSAPAVIYACVLSGITGKVNIALAMNTYNATYDYTQVAVTVTAA